MDGRSQGLSSFIGDLNAILHLDKRLRREGLDYYIECELQTIFAIIRLIDIRAMGNEFTWYNRHK